MRLHLARFVRGSGRFDEILFVFAEIAHIQLRRTRFIRPNRLIDRSHTFRSDTELLGQHVLPFRHCSYQRQL